MNDNIHRAQVTVRAMKLMMEGLEDVVEQLPKNPKLYAFLSEGPLDLIDRMCDELNELLEPVKNTSPAAASPAPIVDNPISSPAAPGPIESAS